MTHGETTDSIGTAVAIAAATAVAVAVVVSAQNRMTQALIERVTD